jgi:hypothetical protein
LATEFDLPDRSYFIKQLEKIHERLRQESSKPN